MTDEQERIRAWFYVGHAVDDALAPRALGDAPAIRTTLVGWERGFEPEMVVAVFSHLPGSYVGAEEAKEIASGYLDEIGWFADGPTPADFVLEPNRMTAETMED